MKNFLLIYSLILFLSNNLVAKENYSFFDVEMGVPLKNEKILTGEFFWAMEVFEPIKKNKTFDRYLLLRGQMTKSVYEFEVSGPIQSFNKCIVNKREFWDVYFMKNYPFIKKDIITNTYSEYGHKLFFDNSLNIQTTCIFAENFKKFIINISYQYEKRFEEDEDFFKQKREEELKKNDITGFEVN